MKNKTLTALFGTVLILVSGLTAWSQDESAEAALAALVAQAQAKTQASDEAHLKERVKQEEVAKALYDLAKKNLYGKSYETAIQQFQELQKKYAHSIYGQEGLYWLGYSLDKFAATKNDLKMQLDMKQSAMEHLDSFLKNFPANAWVKDAKILQVQIAEELAKSGLTKYRKYINNGVFGGVEGGVAGGVEGGVLGGLDGAALQSALEVGRAAMGGKQLDPDTELKLIALNALMTMDVEKAFPILEKMVREEKNPDLREHALFILSQNDSAKVLPLLIGVAEKDPSPEMREKAIFWIGQRGDEQGLAALIRIYDTADAELKDTLLMAIAQSDNPKGIAKITEIAKNGKDPEIQSKAVFWLGQAQGEKVMPLLLDIYKSTDNVKIKQQIIISLSQSDGPKAISTLIDLARKETNFEIKKQLVFWIGQSNSPEALKFLEEVIKK